MKIILLFIAVCLTVALQSQTYTQRIPLFEEFTSSTCGPCAANNPTFDALLSQSGNAGKFACVKYQMNWPGTGDIYYNNDGSSRRYYYGVNSIPDLWVDGTHSGAPASYTQFNFDDEYSTVSNVVIEAHYSWSGSTITVTGLINPLIALSGSIRIYCALVENPTHNNASSNGETSFHYVEQKMIPTGNGTVLTDLTAGSFTPFNLTYNTSSNTHIEDINNLRAIVWLQNVSTKEIYQSAVATIPNGVQNLNTTSSGIISVFPMPVNNFATVEYQLQQNSNVSFTVLDVLGREVKSFSENENGFGLHQNDLDLSDLENGSYFLVMKTNEGIFRQTISVSH